MTSLKERIQEHVATFEVGQSVNTMVDGSEVDGVLEAIDGRTAKVRTRFGVLSSPASLLKAINTVEVKEKTFGDTLGDVGLTWG